MGNLNLLSSNDCLEGTQYAMSPRIKKFVQGIYDGTATLDYALLGNSDIKPALSPIFQISEGLRTADKQKEYYDKGRKVVWKIENNLLKGKNYKVLSEEITDKSQIVTYQPPMCGYHNFGCAIDIIFSKYRWNPTVEFTYNGTNRKCSLPLLYDWVGLVQWGKDCGLSWGGGWSDFPDIAHFEDNTYQNPPQGALWALPTSNCGSYDELAKYYGGMTQSGSKDSSLFSRFFQRIGLRGLLLAGLGFYGLKHLMKSNKRNYRRY